MQSTTELILLATLPQLPDSLPFKNYLTADQTDIQGIKLEATNKDSPWNNITVPRLPRNEQCRST